MSPNLVPLEQEQTFFADPSVDVLMGMTFRLAAELHVTRDRLAAVEQVLQASGRLRPGEVDDFSPDPAGAQAMARARRDYVAYILEPVLGRPASTSV